MWTNKVMEINYNNNNIVPLNQKHTKFKILKEMKLGQMSKASTLYHCKSYIR